MITNEVYTYNKRGTADLLSEKLFQYKDLNAILVGASSRGVVIGSQLSAQLNLPLQIISCKELKHPSKKGFTLGSVSEQDVVLNAGVSDIPQDFIAHQIILLQHAIRFEREQYSGTLFPYSLKYKIVILIADEVTDANSVLAGIESIKKQSPLKIVLAAGSVARKEIKTVSDAVDEVIYLEMN